jgi:hypothetical protein
MALLLQFFNNVSTTDKFQKVNPIIDIYLSVDALNIITLNQIYVKLNSVATVRERTIPTERPTLVREIRANFCR